MKLCRAFEIDIHQPTGTWTKRLRGETHPTLRLPTSPGDTPASSTARPAFISFHVRG
jgi:hypothetical protein